MSEKHECTCIRFGECHVHGFGGVASPQATRHTEDCCLDLDHKGDCKRWMKLPPNSAYPNFKEIHIQDDWCPKAGCAPATQCDITAAHGAAQPAAGTTPRLLEKGDNVVYDELRQIYCCKGAEFCRPTLEKAWKEIARLTTPLAQGVVPYECSSCGSKYLLNMHPGFCPQCGISHEDLSEGTTPQAERPAEKARKAREIEIKNLRFYAKLFEEHKWGTPNISTSVFPATLRDIADRIESTLSFMTAPNTHPEDGGPKEIAFSPRAVAPVETPRIIGIDLASGPDKQAYVCSSCGTSETPCEHYDTGAKAAQTRLTAEQFAQQEFGWLTTEAKRYMVTMAGAFKLAEAFRDKSESQSQQFAAQLESNIQFLNERVAEQKRYIDQCHTAHAGLREEIERLKLLLPDSLNRPMSERIEGLLERADREANLAAELRAKLAALTERFEAAFTQCINLGAEAAALRERYAHAVKCMNRGCKECNEALSAAPERGKDGKDAKA